MKGSLQEAWARQSERLKKHRKKRIERDKLLGWPVPKAMRRRIEESFCVCEYCGLAPWAGITIDRIVPGARGGRYDPDNMTGACIRCNTQKCAKDFVGPVRSLADMEVQRV